MNPNQLALQNKAALEAQGYVVDAQGRVSHPSTGSGFLPPWSWAASIPSLANANVTLGGVNQGSQANPYALTPGFPESAWHGMFQSNGPFSTPAAWDSSNATYDTSTDWGTLLGTAAVGSLFAAPVIGAALGGGGSAAADAGGVPFSASGAGTVGGQALSEGVPFSASGAGTVGGTTLGGSALSAATAGAASAPWVKALATLAGALGGKAISSAAGNNAVPPQLNDLLNMAVQRQQQQQPLAQSVDQGIYSMLPNYARVGTSMPNVPVDASGALQGAKTMLGVR